MLRASAFVVTAVFVLFCASCSTSTPTEPAPEVEVVTCSTDLAGFPTFEASMFIIASRLNGSTPSAPEGFAVMGFTKENPDPKTKAEESIILSIRAITPGTYKVQYPFGTGVGFIINGVSYTALSGTVTVTRFDEVGG